jgi:hypothetical protein
VSGLVVAGCDGACPESPLTPLPVTATVACAVLKEAAASNRSQGEPDFGGEYDYDGLDVSTDQSATCATQCPGQGCVIPAAYVNALLFAQPATVDAAGDAGGGAALVCPTVASPVTIQCGNVRYCG